MWRGEVAQEFALAQCMINEAKLPLWQVSEAAVNQLRGTRGSRAREVARLDQRNTQSAQGRIARDCGAIDPAPDDAEIELLARHPREAIVTRETGWLRRGQSDSSWKE